MKCWMSHNLYLALCFFRSICEMNLEVEFFALQDSNTKLVAALNEANANVEQWKKQLTAYQEETDRLREQVHFQHKKHSWDGLLLCFEFFFPTFCVVTPLFWIFHWNLLLLINTKMAIVRKQKETDVVFSFCFFF